MKTFTNKELKRGGVYSITNTVTGEIYYGNTGNLLQRLNGHISTFNRGMHVNPKFRSSGQGGCDFMFKVLHFEQDSVIRKDLEKAYQLRAKEKGVNREMSLVKFDLAVSTINNKMNYAKIKTADYASIPLCYKTK